MEICSLFCFVIEGDEDDEGVGNDLQFPHKLLLPKFIKLLVLVDQFISSDSGDETHWTAELTWYNYSTFSAIDEQFKIISYAVTCAD